MRRECECREPNPYQHPEKGDTCVQCSGYISPRWTSNNQTVAAFFDRLEQSMFPVSLDDLPDWWERFRMHCEARELAGRSRFRHSLCRRNNPGEGMEEAADGALYALFDCLVSRRAGEDEEIDIALTAAYHFAKAHEALSHLHDGDPRPISDFTQD